MSVFNVASENAVTLPVAVRLEQFIVPKVTLLPLFVAWLELKVVYPAPLVMFELFKVIFPVPSNETPEICLAVASLVAVAALPVVSVSYTHLTLPTKRIV